MLLLARAYLSYVVPCAILCAGALRGPPSLHDVLLGASATVCLLGFSMSVCLHRYFAHSAFRTYRCIGCLLGLASCMAYQNGPIWWASKHRRHHRHCDDDMDPHSWSATSFVYAFVGWTLAAAEQQVDAGVADLQDRSELVLIDAVSLSIPLSTVAAAYCVSGARTAVLCMASMFACRMITLLFNCEYHRPTASPGCRAVNAPRLLAELVGESYHLDHHDHPKKAHRPGLDLPFWLFVRPMRACKLLW